MSLKKTAKPYDFAKKTLPLTSKVSNKRDA